MKRVASIPIKMCARNIKSESENIKLYKTLINKLKKELVEKDRVIEELILNISNRSSFIEKTLDTDDYFTCSTPNTELKKKFRVTLRESL